MLAVNLVAAGTVTVASQQLQRAVGWQPSQSEELVPQAEVGAAVGKPVNVGRLVQVVADTAPVGARIALSARIILQFDREVYRMRHRHIVGIPFYA